MLVVRQYVYIIWLCSHLWTDTPSLHDTYYVPRSQRGTWPHKLKKGMVHLLSQAAQSIDTFVTRHTTSTGHTPRRSISPVVRCKRTLCRRRLGHLVLMSSIIAMDARHTKPRERTTVFDTDSRAIGIDNRASACISDNPDDFDGPLRKCTRAIKGFGGTTTHNVFMGTLWWSWEDDDGKVHSFTIPRSYYVPHGNVRLLSPQHWARTQKDTKPIIGTLEVTDHEKVVLYWNQRQFKRTVPLGQVDNVATLRLAPGFTRYTAFCKDAGLSNNDDSSTPMTLDETTIIPPDEDEDTAVPHQPPRNPWTSPSTSADIPESPHTVDMDATPPATKTHNGIPIVEDDALIERELRTLPNDEALLLHYHHKFGHISFKRLQDMARIGIIPKRLAKCRVPVCSACLYAKASKRPWRSKPRSDYPPPRKLDPGDVISVDQMVSPTPGLIAQITGIPTIKRYKYATVFVDQATRFGYVHLQKSATAEETIEGKHAFQKIMLDRGITVRAYHADNGIFRANKWRDACAKEQQGLTFAGVNAHHANGIAEKRIRDLQDLTRTQLIHATKKWEHCITVNLWPYALLMANNVLNNTPLPSILPPVHYLIYCRNNN